MTDVKLHTTIVVLALWATIVVLFNIVPWMIRETLRLRRADADADKEDRDG
jgi:hypothetical protein